MLMAVALSALLSSNKQRLVSLVYDYLLFLPWLFVPRWNSYWYLINHSAKSQLYVGAPKFCRPPQEVLMKI
jgi:hypothetical protein